MFCAVCATKGSVPDAKARRLGFRVIYNYRESIIDIPLSSVVVIGWWVSRNVY